MSTTTKERRRHRRFAVRDGQAARIAFEDRGRAFDCPILDVSASGLSFAFDAEELAPSLEPGATIDGCVLRFKECTLRGDLLVMHVTDSPGSRQICGALIYPATDADLLKLRSLVVGMELAGAD